MLQVWTKEKKNKTKQKKNLPVGISYFLFPSYHNQQELVERELSFVTNQKPGVLNLKDSRYHVAGSRAWWEDTALGVDAC